MVHRYYVHICFKGTCIALKLAYQVNGISWSSSILLRFCFPISVVFVLLWYFCILDGKVFLLKIMTQTTVKHQDICVIINFPFNDCSKSAITIWEIFYGEIFSTGGMIDGIIVQYKPSLN